jgi:hypothetical protein
VTRRGWPDFIVYRPDGDLYAIVEVKPYSHNGPKRDQRVVMGLLADAGLPVGLWNPITGYEPFR